MKKAKNKIELPRGYLSPSSLQLFLTSQQHWIDKYIYSRNKFTNEYMELGKLLAEVFEGKKKDEGIEFLKSVIPHYSEREYPISCHLSRKGETIELRGILDGWEQKKQLQGEYKTGKLRWTQERANKSLQLKMYALIKYKNTGKIPDQELTWIQTFKNGRKGDVNFTGDYQTFHVKHSLQTMLETESLIWKTYDKIIKVVEQENKKL